MASESIWELQSSRRDSFIMLQNSGSCARKSEAGGGREREDGGGVVGDRDTFWEGPSRCRSQDQRSCAALGTFLETCITSREEGVGSIDAASPFLCDHPEFLDVGVFLFRRGQGQAPRAVRQQLRRLAAVDILAQEAGAAAVKHGRRSSLIAL
jgi:hypothetical protein